MSSKQELYKVKSRNGLGSRDARTRLKTQESKSGRDALLLSKRRIPLSAVQEEQPTKDKLSEGEQRLHKLKEWKAKRDEAKAREKAVKKQPFSCGGGRPGATNSSVKSTSSAAGNGTTYGNARAVAADKSTAARPTKAGNNAVSKSASTNLNSGKEGKAAAIKKSASRETGTKNLPPKSVATSGSGKPPQPAKRVSKRIAAKQVQEEAKPVVETRQSSAAKKRAGAKPSADKTKQPIRITRSSASKDTTKTGTNNETSATSGRKTKNSGKNTDGVSGLSGKKRVKTETSGAVMSGKKRVNASAGPSSGKKRVKTVATPINTRLMYQDSSSDATSPPSPSPPSSHTHTPPQNAVPCSLTPRHQALPSPGPNSIPDCAWVPNQHVSARASVFQSVDDVFGTATFSPFKFTAGQNTTQPSGRSKRKATPRKPFLFSFRKTLDCHDDEETPLSLQAGTVDHVTSSTNHVTRPADHVIQSDATADSMSADSLDCTSSPTVTMAPGTATATNSTNDIESSEQHDEEKADELDTREEPVSEPVCGDVASPPGGGSGVEDITSSDTAKEGIDFPYFHRLHDDVAADFSRRCSDWREKSDSVQSSLDQREEEDEEKKHLEEVIDQIRTTVCQAELLMRKKMKQYLGLVTNAESDGGKTTAEDLQGFWDLVSIQVDELCQKFENLAELERNNWKQPQPMEQNQVKKRGKKRLTAVSAKRKECGVSERGAAARERRVAMRTRLREMKMAAKAAAATTTEREEQEGEGVTEREEEKEGEGVKVSGEIVAVQRKENTNSSDTTSGETPSTPPHDDCALGNTGCHSSTKRKSTGKTRRQSRRSMKRVSVALIDFSQLPESSSSIHHPPSTPSPTTTQPLTFSLPPSSPLPPQKTSPPPFSCDVPTANLLNIHNSPPPFKSPRKWFPKGMNPVKKHSVPRGASVRQFASVTPSKRMKNEERMRELLEADIIMSPVRRSLRIADKGGTTEDGSHGNYQVTSLNDLPDELDIAYLPNKALS